MTNKEAIEKFKRIKRGNIFLIHQRIEGKEVIEDYSLCDMAITALEKQIPKKPIRIDKNKEFDGNWKKVCPSCGRVLMERITTSESSYPQHYNYTGHCWCGQAIDWEEEE